jgi:uncharacterized protein YdhG (YjbR/CyaY superfamily)
MADTKKTTTSRRRTDASDGSFTAEERAAMKDHAEELKRARGVKGSSNAAAEEAAVLAKIAEMDKPDRVMAERLHEIVKSAAPNLTCRTWYGMPAYVKEGKIVLFFQPATKFKTRYSTLGFTDEAKLDEGSIWPNAYALTDLSPEVEKKVVALIKKAIR